MGSREGIKRKAMGVFSYRMVGMKRWSKGVRGRDVFLRAAGVGQQGGSWDSPGKGKPQEVKVMYYALL